MRYKSPAAFGLKDMALEPLYKRVTTFMTQTKAGTGPTIQDLQGVMRDVY